jgi:O-antigen/teichoic acid export membrane protein
VTDPYLDAQRGWRTVLRRSAALLIGDVVARTIGFVVVLLLARRLGPEGFGVITLGLVLVGWLRFVVDSGTELHNVREVARQPARFREIAEQMLGLRLVLSVVAAVLFVVGVEIFARSEFTRDTVILFAACFPAIALNLRWMVLGIGGSRAVAVGNAASRGFVLIGALLLVFDASDIEWVPLLEAGGELAYALVILAFAIWKLGWLRPRASLSYWWATLSGSLPLMISGVARATIFSVDILIIDLALGPREVGIYGVAIRPVAFASGAVGLFSLSYLSALSATASEHIAALHGRALRVSLVACVIVAACLSVSSLLIPFVFGNEYSDAVPVMAILSWRIPLAALSLMYISLLVAQDRQLTLMWNNIIALAFILVIDVVLITTFGLIGAAVASVIASGITFLVNYRSIRGYIPELRVRRSVRGRSK